MEYSLRNLSDMYEQTQRTRIAAENRVRATLQGYDETEVSKIVASEALVARFRESEEEINRLMETALQVHPVYPWLMGVPGVNRTLGAKILGMIGDPHNYFRFSNLRTFCGLCPGRNKLVKGEKAIYNVYLKKTLYVAFASMLKTGAVKLSSPPKMLYTDIYRNWRNVYLARYGGGDCKKKENGVDKSGQKYTFPDEEAQAWPDLRQHYASKNKLLDVFLFHIYEEWLQKAYGEQPTLYSHEVLGHHAKFERWDFSSTAMSERKIKEHRAA